MKWEKFSKNFYGAKTRLGLVIRKHRPFIGIDMWLRAFSYFFTIAENLMIRAGK